MDTLFAALRTLYTNLYNFTVEVSAPVWMCVHPHICVPVGYGYGIKQPLTLVVAGCLWSPCRNVVGGVKRKCCTFSVEFFQQSVTIVLCHSQWVVRM